MSQTQLPDAHPTFTSMTPTDVIVSAELNRNAFVELSQSTPLVDALPDKPVLLLKSWIPSAVNADAHQSPHVVVDSSGQASHVHVSLIQTPDVCQHSMPSTPTLAIADAEHKLNANAEQLLSTPLVDALPSHHAQLHKHSMLLNADVSAQELKLAVVDSSSTQSHALVCQIQMPDACQLSTDSIPLLATVFASTDQTVFATLSSTMPPVLVQLCQPVQDLKSSTTMPVNADAQQLRLADVDSSSTPTPAHVKSTQQLCAHLTSTSSTPTDVIVSARLNNNVFVELSQSTPLVPVQPLLLAMLHKYSMQLPVDADVQQSPHAVVDSSGTPTHVHVSLIQTPDVSHHSMPMTPTFAIADAEPTQLVCATLSLSTPLADVQLSQFVRTHKSLTPPTVNADAQPSKHALADSFGMPTLANVSPTQHQDVCLTFTDSTTLLVIASA